MPKVSKSKKIIRFRPELFWDVNPKTIHPKKHARYIIERILDFGTTEEAVWMWQFYGRRLVKDVLDSSRVIHDKSRTFWELVCQ